MNVFSRFFFDCFDTVAKRMQGATHCSLFFVTCAAIRVSLNVKLVLQVTHVPFSCVTNSYALLVFGKNQEPKQLDAELLGRERRDSSLQSDGAGRVGG